MRYEIALQKNEDTHQLNYTGHWALGAVSFYADSKDASELIDE